MSLFDDLNKMADSGGGIVGKVNIETGYKIMVSGVNNKDSFFAGDLRNKEENAKALAQAKAKLAELGNPTRTDKNGKEQPIRPSQAVQIVIYRDSVKGKDVSWNDDRVFCYPLYTDDCKKIVLPSFKNANVDRLGEMWARISFAPTPTGRTKANQNGEQVTELIAFVAEVYASEQAALAAVAGGDVAMENAKATKPTTNGKVPAAYADQPDAWHSYVNDFRNHPDVKGKPKPVIKKYIEANVKAEDIGATLDELYQAVIA